MLLKRILHNNFKGNRGPPVIAVLACYGMYNQHNKHRKACKGLNYTPDEVERHNSLDDFWVSYKDGVYDITNFIRGHPGGIEKIKMAAGGPVEPYWQLYKQHNSKEVRELLEGYRIGNLISDEIPLEDYNPYANEPIRDPTLIKHAVEPFNGETPLKLLRQNYLTPNKYWFVRNHHPTPDIDESEYSLKLHMPNKLVSLDMANLKAYPKRRITTTIQCAGNRRDEYNSIGKVSGTKWRGGAMSTACWEGVYLRDILIVQGIDVERCKDKYVTVWGQDEDFRISISFRKVMDTYGDVLLAYHMNSEKLPRDHGYPIRLIVPGSAGTKQVKYVTNIEITDKPCDGPWQSGVAYKMLPSHIKDFSQVTEKLLTSTVTADILPVQSIICDINNNNNNKSNTTIKGIAWSGNGNNITRVDVSIDGGKSWTQAVLKEGSDQLEGMAWAWTFWDLEISLEQYNTATEIICKATDIHYNTQPIEISSIWNLRGILNNSWHSIIIVK